MMTCRCLNWRLRNVLTKVSAVGQILEQGSLPVTMRRLVIADGRVVAHVLQVVLRHLAIPVLGVDVV